VILSESNIRVANVVDYVCWHNLHITKENRINEIVDICLVYRLNIL